MIISEKVLKRDTKTLQVFDEKKIHDAIYKAVLASHTQEELKYFDSNVLDGIVSEIHKLLNPIPYYMSDNNSVIYDINDIQNTVERVLIKRGYADTAKAYILYRNKRDEIRNTRDSITNTISDILLSDSKDNNDKRENGNVDGDTAMGTMLQVGSNVSKNYYLNNMMSKDIAKAHIDGYIHIHDLDFYKLTMTCCQIDFEKLAKGGFNTGHGFLREPNSISSYTTLAAIAIQSNQNDMYGGQSIPNFDYSMRQGIYKSFRKSWKRNIEKAIDFGIIGEDDFILAITPNIFPPKSIYGKITSYFGDEYTYVRIRDIFESNDIIESVLTDVKDYQYHVKEKTGDCLDEQIYKIIEMTKKDVERECYQAMEGFVHNLNTLHSRAGAQVK